MGGRFMKVKTILALLVMLFVFGGCGKTSYEIKPRNIEVCIKIDECGKIYTKPTSGWIVLEVVHSGCIRNEVYKTVSLDDAIEYKKLCEKALAESKKK
jgi:hypothetical protein